MAKERFINKRFSWATEIVIDQAIDIIREYSSKDMKLTLRQLYYQFVARDLLKNSMKEYSRLGRIITDARMTGLIDWNSIEDRTRNIRSVPSYRDVSEILEIAAHSFKLNPWKGQEYYMEVWIEKEALIGVIESICRDLRVPWFACKGYVSKSEMYSSAKRMKYQWQLGRQPIIIHLGDHDPSGVDMTRDIESQHSIFRGMRAQVNRIALNMDQIDRFKPPPNPAKIKDSRAKEYIKNFGQNSWELDALNPEILRSLVKKEVKKYRDQEKYEEVLSQEQEQKGLLLDISENWEDMLDSKKGE